MKFPSPRSIPAAAVSLLFSLFSQTALQSAELFSESFDSGETVALEQLLGSGMTVNFVDYSSMEAGALVHSIPEAPRRIPGSAPTRGVLMKADYSATFEQRTGNLVALDAASGNRLTLTDNYRLKFDVYLRLPPNVTVGANGVPVETGTTEQMLWGVGYTSQTFMGRNWRSSRGNGMWGFLSTEGGYSDLNGGDVSLFENREVIGGRNMSVAVTPVPFFTDAFGADASPVPHCPANQWVEATVTVRAGQITVEYRAAGRAGAAFFGNITPVDPAAVEGSVMVGYEDSATSISFDPDNQWMLVDNMVVEDLAPPSLVVKPALALSSFTGTPVTGTFSVRNTRAAGALTISAVNFSGADAAAFSTVTPLPLPVPAGAATELAVRFNPPAPNGVKTALMTVISDDPDRPSYTLPAPAARRTVGTFFGAHYKLDETAGPALTDSSGSGAAGRYEIREPLAFGQPALPQGPGTGTSVEFIGANTTTTGNYFTSPAVHTPSFTVAFWIKPSAGSGTNRTLFQRDYNTAAPVDKLYSLILTPSNGLSYHVNSTPVLTYEDAPLEDDQVWHIALTHLDEDGFGNDTAARCRLYVNGIKVAETAPGEAQGFRDYPLNAAVTLMHFASRATAGAGYSGAMDDVQIYGAELTPEQIAALFSNPGSTATPPAVTEFAVTSARLTATGAFAVEFPSSSTSTYTLLRSENLSAWTPVGESVPGAANASVTVIEDPSPPAGKQFYRVQRN